MNEAKYILKALGNQAPKQFLSLGEWPEVEEALVTVGATGIVADHKADSLPDTKPNTYQERITYIHGPVAMTNHYMQVGDNVMMRGITHRELLDRFPGPFDVLLINVVGLGKELATSDEVWTSWPVVICVKSEGREQEIMNLASAHSYSPYRIERDFMILTRPA